MIDKIKMLIKSPRFSEIFRFGVNGGICFVVDWGIMMLLNMFVFSENLHWISVGISFSVSVILNYILCVAWVFKGAGKQDAKAKAVFIGSSVLGLLWTEFLMWIFEKAIPASIAKIFVTLIVMVWNYFMKRIAVYGGKNKEN